MEKIIITIEVNGDTEAYRVLNKIANESKVLEADYKGKKYKFNKNNLSQNFLKKKGEFLNYEKPI